MVHPTSRLVARLALVLGASALSLSGCLPAPADESFDEADTDQEGLSGSLQVGTALNATTSVNLRSGPSTSSAVLDVLAAGTTVTLQTAAPSNGFYQVLYAGVVGWMSGKYLEPASGGVTGPAAATLTTTNDVNLRSGPSTSAKVLTVLPTGAEVTVVQPDPVSGFYNVSYQGMSGWTSGKYLGPGGASVPVEGGKAWKFRAKTLPIDVAVFIPLAADTAPDVDVLLYAHGHNVCSPVAQNPPLSFVTEQPFNLAKIVDATKRPVVLVVPFLDWEHLGANGMAFGGSHHKLGIPANLNGVVAEVLAQVGQHRNAGAPGIASLILAGHSRAYDVLNPLAAASADPQMATGALAHLTQVWGLDTGYVCSPIQTWTTWLKSKPALEITMDYRAGTQTASCGQQFAGLVPSSGGRLSVNVVKEEHCAIPATELPGLLSELP